MHREERSEHRTSGAYRVYPERSRREVAVVTRGASETVGGWLAQSHHLTDVSGHLLRKEQVAPPGTCPQVARRAACRTEVRRCAGDRAPHPFTCNGPHTLSRNSLKTQSDARFGPRFSLRLSPIPSHLSPVFFNRNTPEVKQGQPHENKEPARFYIATKTHLFEEKAKPAALMGSVPPPRNAGFSLCCLTLEIKMRRRETRPGAQREPPVNS